MTKLTVKGPVGGCDVTIRVNGPETEAERIMTDLKARAEEVRQMVEDGTAPDETEPPMTVDWAGFIAGEYDEVDHE